MTSGAGWTMFGISVAAGLLVYYLDGKLNPAAGKTSGAAYIGPSGGLPSSQSNSAPAQTSLTNEDADIDGGTPADPQVQTEAAYNVNAGASDLPATGINAQQTDFDSFDDPSEFSV